MRSNRVVLALVIWLLILLACYQAYFSLVPLRKAALGTSLNNQTRLAGAGVGDSSLGSVVDTSLGGAFSEWIAAVKLWFWDPELNETGRHTSKPAHKPNATDPGIVVLPPNSTLAGALPGSRVQIVIARFNEDLSWLGSKRLVRYNDVVVYDKSGHPLSDGRDGTSAGRARVVLRPNVGKCDETYMRHIVENYDRLADVTVFLPGTSQDMILDTAPKRTWTRTLLDAVDSTKTSVFPSIPVSEGVRVKDSDFILPGYQTTNQENIAGPIACLLAPIRPFGLWYDAMFPEIKTPVRAASFGGIFAVAREHVTQHPVSRYQKLLDQLSTHPNPEAGHYVERAMTSIFYPYPASCVHLRPFWPMKYLPPFALSPRAFAALSWLLQCYIGAMEYMDVTRSHELVSSTVDCHLRWECRWF